MGGAFNKDGIATIIVECLPGGGLLTAPVHFISGNPGHGAAALAGAALGAVLPGGGPLLKIVANGAKVAIAKRAVAAVVVKAATVAAAKHAIKKGANAIKKSHK